MKLNRVFRIAPLGAALLLISGCSQADPSDEPAAVAALKGQGLTVLQEFDVGNEMRGFAGVAGDNPVAVYVTKDGNAIVGTRVNPRGESIDEMTLRDLVSKPMAKKSWEQLEAAKWVLDGRADAPRVVYTFSDPNCPYCNRFWQAARPWVDSGKVQIRHLLVGVIRADSAPKAAAILEAQDPSAALQENERNAGRGGIKAASSVSAQARSTLTNNELLMVSQGFRGTPGIVYMDERGELKKINGMPQGDALQQAFGPL